MKTRVFSIIVCTLLLIVSGCGKPVKEEPKSIIGSTEQPSWTAPMDYDMTSSMTAIVKIDLSGVYTSEQLSAAKYELTDGDLVAAFAGNECLGVAELQDGLYYLYICAPTSEQDVTIHYYSKVLKTIFRSAPFAFADGGHLGSIASPYTPTFTPAN